MDVRLKRATFLTRLALENVKSFAGEHVLNLVEKKGNPARWTLILGDNGVGKTTLLECLAHLTPVFNSPDAKGDKDPPLVVDRPAPYLSAPGAGSSDRITSAEISKDRSRASWSWI